MLIIKNIEISRPAENYIKEGGKLKLSINSKK